VPTRIDGALYPDTDVPEAITALGECVDFPTRMCAAWDFGIIPRQEIIDEVRRPGWREAVDACNFLTSPSYHLVCKWHNLPLCPI
jgi:hypothetical protein